MTEFTPVYSAIGGALIGLSAMLLLMGAGRIAGISGILGGLVDGAADKGWRWSFLAGVIGASLAYPLLSHPEMPALIVQLDTSSFLTMAVAGLLVGYGTRLGSGCTSGHGVCGIGRFSNRSIAATVIFMATAAVTVWISRHLLGAV